MQKIFRLCATLAIIGIASCGKGPPDTKSSATAPTVGQIELRIEKRQGVGTRREILYYLGLITAEGHAFYDDDETEGGSQRGDVWEIFVLDEIEPGLRLVLETRTYNISTPEPDHISICDQIELYRVDQNDSRKEHPITRKALSFPIAGG